MKAMKSNEEKRSPNWVEKYREGAFDVLSGIEDLIRFQLNFVLAIKFTVASLIVDASYLGLKYGHRGFSWTKHSIKNLYRRLSR